MPYKDLAIQIKYQADRYLAKKQEYIERSQERKKEYRRIIHEYKADKPCMDCGNYYPYYVMDLDHRDRTLKKFRVSFLGACPSVKSLLAEIAKCDLVCANCHRTRTYTRKDYVPVG